MCNLNFKNCGKRLRLAKTIRPLLPHPVSHETSYIGYLKLSTAEFPIEAEVEIDG